MRDFPRLLSYPKVVKETSYIDVIWFTGDTDALVPEYAFEVEHTIEVTKGLGRLFDLYKAGLRPELFIVLPDKELDKFHTENIKTIITICSVYDRSFDN
ncbi:Uncharacterised protein [uncultured archaeon]|nr:Uncharacterised protein [uncultured archaeon]